MVGVGGGAIGIVGVIFALLLGVNPFEGGGGFGIETPGLDGTSGGAPSELAGASCKEGASRVEVFSACVFEDAQRTWSRLFEASGQRYRPSTFVLYTSQVSTSCGTGTSAAGPFYCPTDEKVYLDTSFFEELRSRFGAGGDFAAAYVIAHEVGHHVQTVVGTNDEVQRAQNSKPDDANELSVRLELQADCYSGVWAHAAQAAGSIRLEPGDTEEALNAAGAIGDDRLQRQAGKRVNPESFTHGSSEDRVRWLNRGLKNGNPADCDTFGSG